MPAATRMHPWSGGSATPPDTSSCAIPIRRWPWSSGSPRPRRGCGADRRRQAPRAEPRGRRRHADEPVSGLRVIQGGRAAEGLPGLLIEGASEVVTMAGGLRRGAAQDEPALLEASAADPGGEHAPVVAAWDGRILAAGPRAELLRALDAGGYPLSRFARLDAAGGTVTPGLVDPHTHLVFGGSREGELVLRQRGAGYLEILAAGGGILSTVAATRAATAEELAAHGRMWLDEMLTHGVTTIEAKSGYGLDLATELRLLDVAFRLGAAGPVDVLPTWLGAHAVPAEFRTRPDGAEAYVRHCIEEQLPGVAAQGRARSCDVFCERG